MNDTTSKVAMVTVDKGTAGAIRGELVGGDHAGWYIRELGTQRCDWFQKERCTVDAKF